MAYGCWMLSLDHVMHQTPERRYKQPFHLRKISFVGKHDFSRHMFFFAERSVCLILIFYADNAEHFYKHQNSRNNISVIVKVTQRRFPQSKI